MSLPGLSLVGNLLSKGPDPLGLFGKHGLNGPPGLDGNGPPGLNGQDHDGPQHGRQPNGPDHSNGPGNNYPPAHGREEVPVNVARQLDAPGNLPAPSGLPSLPGPPAAPVANLVQQVVAVPGNLLNALVGNPPPGAGPQPPLAATVQTLTAPLAAAAQALQAPGALPQTLAAMTTAGAALALPANVGAMAGTLAAAGQTASVANAAATSMAATAPAAQTAAAAATATTLNPQATTAATMRSDAIPVPPRPESTTLLDRLANALRMNAAPATMAPAASLPASVAAQSAVAAAMPMAAAPPSQAPPVDARGMPLTINDRAQAARADGAILPGGYTGEGLQRRTLRGRAEGLLTTPMTRLLMALGAAGNPAAMSEAEARLQAERDLERAMQWVFWVLAIVAYGCVAMAMIGLLAGGGHSDFFDHFSLAGSRPQSFGFAFVGLIAGGIAWWLARRLSRR